MNEFLDVYIIFSIDIDIDNDDG